MTISQNWSSIISQTALEVVWRVIKYHQISSNIIKYHPTYLRRLSKLSREPPPPRRCSPSTSPTSSYFSPWRYCSLWCWWKCRQWWWRQGQRWLFEAGPPSPFPFSALPCLALLQSQPSRLEPWSNSDLHLPSFHRPPTLHYHLRRDHHEGSQFGAVAK